MHLASNKKNNRKSRSRTFAIINEIDGNTFLRRIPINIVEKCHIFERINHVRSKFVWMCINKGYDERKLWWQTISKEDDVLTDEKIKVTNLRVKSYEIEETILFFWGILISHFFYSIESCLTTTKISLLLMRMHT